MIFDLTLILEGNNFIFGIKLYLKLVFKRHNMFSLISFEENKIRVGGKCSVKLKIFDLTLFGRK